MRTSAQHNLPPHWARIKKGLKWVLIHLSYPPLRNLPSQMINITQKSSNFSWRPSSSSIGMEDRNGLNRPLSITVPAQSWLSDRLITSSLPSGVLGGSPQSWIKCPQRSSSRSKMLAVVGDIARTVYEANIVQNWSKGYLRLFSAPPAITKNCTWFVA